MSVREISSTSAFGTRDNSQNADYTYSVHDMSDESNFRVVIDMKNQRKENVKVEIFGQKIVVTAKELQNNSSSSSFRSVFNLPVNVDLWFLSAHWNDKHQTLELTAPIREEAEEPGIE
ncbi:unnamed protein product [Soboliphyme baturini]|uniref:SHSP domain-containing protein n=1 Tax=Soboliphyme baturini TaxID=241478 RepID=A0A183J975_9BILA|nr:unnamed protein product [Soboliphyme baturini]